MKKFLKYFFGVVLTVFLLMLVLEYVYTYAYTNSTPRTKFQYLLSMSNKKIEYIFLGSSRVENSIIPAVVEAKTGKKAINLGFQAAKLKDIYMILKLVKKNNIQFEKIFIQIDYIYNLEGNSNMLEYELMPFVHNNEVVKEHVLNISENGQSKVCLPFLRYANYDQKIGFREFVLNVAKKHGNALDEKGYAPLYGSTIVNNYYLPETIVAKNKTFDKIKKFCNDNNIDVVFFCAPFCSKAKNMDFIDKLKTKIPELKDFSRAVDNPKMFQNCSHLNDEGARYFTEVLIDTCLKKRISNNY
jgi:hypothetical protein